MKDGSFAPKNVGIIMDGNGRWAESRGLERSVGHTHGMANMLKLAARAFELGAENFVCFSLSTENLKRSKGELEHILSLVTQYFDPFIEVCRTYRISAKFVGSLHLLPEKIRASLKRTEETLSQFSSSGRCIYIAIAYGSRAEITEAANKAVKMGKTVTEADFLSLLGLPVDLDLVIRTGGEKRLSNFFLYQASYAELYFSDKYFPDFDGNDLEAAFDWFSTRNRRYGNLG